MHLFRKRKRDRETFALNLLAVLLALAFVATSVWVYFNETRQILR
jgi:heme/copper-type cytochrome/quinol oxidase subunit 4